MLENETARSPLCPHTHVERRLVRSEFFKREFLADVDECRDCGLKLWTPETQRRFHEWVLGLKHEKRDMFQVQFYLPVPARQNLLEFLKRFPGVPMSVLIRAMTTVYLTSIVRFPEFVPMAEKLANRPSYTLVTVGVKRKTSLQFNPMALLDIQSWSDILKLPPYKIVEEAIYKFLALKDETDDDMREFWDRKLLPQLELILRAV